MRFRRAATVVAYFSDSTFVLHNFLTDERISCSPEAIEFLSALTDWQTPKQLLKRFPQIDSSSLAMQVSDFIKYNVLVMEKTKQADLDEIYRKEWQWGESAGFFHFSTRATTFVTGKRAREFMQKRVKWRTSPKLYDTNVGKNPVPLPRTDVTTEPFALMRRRRSRREFDGTPLSKKALADCLFAGNGIVEYRSDKDYGRYPITMTPSGGARNPFELFVYARNVEGLAPGFYHYGAPKHNLGLVRTGTVDVPAMLGTQEWPSKAGAIIFLVANFPRSMWKYHMPMAYRVVMMEAGFIGQNVALAATHHGLSAVPSGALDPALIESYLKTRPIESAVIFSLSIGRPIKVKHGSRKA